MYICCPFSFSQLKLTISLVAMQQEWSCVMLQQGREQLETQIGTLPRAKPSHFGLADVVYLDCQGRVAFLDHVGHALQRMQTLNWDTARMKRLKEGLATYLISKTSIPHMVNWIFDLWLTTLFNSSQWPWPLTTLSPGECLCQGCGSVFLRHSSRRGRTDGQPERKWLLDTNAVFGSRKEKCYLHAVL